MEKMFALRIDDTRELDRLLDLYAKDDRFTHVSINNPIFNNDHIRVILRPGLEQLLLEKSSVTELPSVPPMLRMDQVPTPQTMEKIARSDRIWYLNLPSVDLRILQKNRSILFLETWGFTSLAENHSVIGLSYQSRPTREILISLRGWNRLRHLDLTGTGMTDDLIPFLPPIESVDLSNNLLSTHGIKKALRMGFARASFDGNPGKVDEKDELVTGLREGVLGDRNIKTVSLGEQCIGEIPSPPQEADIVISSKQFLRENAKILLYCHGRKFENTKRMLINLARATDAIGMMLPPEEEYDSINVKKNTDPTILTDRDLPREYYGKFNVVYSVACDGTGSNIPDWIFEKHSKLLYINMVNALNPDRWCLIAGLERKKSSRSKRRDTTEIHNKYIDSILAVRFPGVKYEKKRLVDSTFSKNFDLLIRYFAGYLE